ncbi:unnamed protein product [Closterium sp. Naga37s-1]|nr:unnamed protein product [Closterium sp. Naga37s-1]
MAAASACAIIPLSCFPAVKCAPLRRDSRVLGGSLSHSASNLKPHRLHTPRLVGSRIASSGRAVTAAGGGGSSDRKNADVNKVAVLRELLTSPGIKCAPACHDGLSARLTEAAGFKLAFMSGFAVSATRAGLPDTGLLSYGEMVEAGRLIASAAPGIPVIGDGDTGYGNAVNVRRTVRGYRQAGMAGIIIEDQAWPKACGHTAGRRVVGRDEAVMRIRAAADERDEGQGDIVIVARSDACQAVSLDEALWRAAAFADAGADMVFIDALGSEEDMRAFVRAVPNTPKLINQLEGGGRTPILSPQQLEDMGFAIAVYPLSLVGVCTRAMQDALSALASGRLPRPSLLPPFEELKEAVGFPEYLALEERYKTVEDDDGSSWSSGRSRRRSDSDDADAAAAAAASARAAAEAQAEEAAAAARAAAADAAAAAAAAAAGANWQQQQQQQQYQSQQQQSQSQQQQQQQQWDVVEPMVIEPDETPGTGSEGWKNLERTRSSSGGGGGGWGNWTRVLRVQVLGQNNITKLDFRVPAGFLGSLANTIPAVAGIDLAGMVERAATRAQSEGGGGGDDEVVVVDFKDKTTGDRVRILLE